MRIITQDDLIDLYCRLRQRGWSFIRSKFTTNAEARTKSAFDESSVQASHWWKIPMVRERWNAKISGRASMAYEDYFVGRHLKDKEGLQLLSLGSGSCSHELKFASFPQFKKVTCVDLAENRLTKAKKKAVSLGYDHMEFICADVHELKIVPNSYDVILFHSALHHMYHVDELLGEKVKQLLRKGGMLLINEYVGPDRLQYPKEQITAINQALSFIPAQYRTRFKTSLTKNSYHGSGWLRMVIADPSECADSASIVPSLHNNFEVIEEKPYGGNILMPVLKDIAHHFYQPGPDKKEILQDLFDHEDQFLEDHSSDFLYGLYRNS